VTRRTMAVFLGNRLLQVLARLILGGVFIYAGLSKIGSSAEFARIVANYGILPESLAVYFAFVLPWIETALGLLLVIGLGIKKAALALSLLLVVFAAAVLIRSLSGAAGGCGCFSLKSSGADSIFLIIGRDLGLLACGVYLFFSAK
jgi:putative oxidoreductase